jgi:hypothetical protein
MKTSYILLAIIVLLTLTGMVATDLLLKQEYDKIDWRNPYQEYDKISLPNAKHWVIEGTPTEEIIVEQTNSNPYVLVTPTKLKFYRAYQKGDTVFVAFTPDYSGEQSEPRNVAEYKLSIGLVLRLPSLQTLQIKNGRLTLSELTKENLQVTLQNSRLRTQNLSVSKTFDLIARQNSFAALGKDRFQMLRTIVQDSSGVQLNDTQIETFTNQAAPKAEVQLRGQALKWLK